MGNEGSQPAGLEIEEKAVEATDAWTLHYASISCGNPRLSVFVGQSQEGRSPAALELSAKNLMLYRHPSIVKYISSWKRGDCWNLATEEVKPLAEVLPQLTPIQICLGLHSILEALIFLHEKAEASHNNICCASIYLSHDGSWKLGGFENLCRFKDLTPEFLHQTRMRRYDRGIAPEEEEVNGLKTVKGTILEPWAIDTYAFGVLAEELLRSATSRTLGATSTNLSPADELPALTDFKDLLKKHLQHSNPSLRAKLSSVLKHPFFAHPLISIHGFLIDLPLKAESEKEDFFRHLPSQLSEFPEALIASQLGALLLSRMVLINSSAQEYLVPRILNLRPDGSSKALSVEEEEDLGGASESMEALFSVSTFREHLAPRLLQIFGVRDAQIRLVLLKHFNGYFKAFTDENLRSVVLPELLVGIKDTNDTLVSTTLHALADLVPLLGSATVIGGKRGKIFADGRPKKRTIPSLESSRISSRIQSASLNGNISGLANYVRTRAADTLGAALSTSISGATCEKMSQLFNVRESLETHSAALYHDAVVDLPERPSPDGGEERAKPDTEAEEDGLEEVTVDWSDWDAPEEDLENSITTEQSKVSEISSITISDSRSRTVAEPLSEVVDDSNNEPKESRSSKEKSKVSQAEEEEDFFKDMEPVISKTQILRIESPETSKQASASLNAFSKVTLDSTADIEGSGWEDDLEWGDEELEIS